MNTPAFQHPTSLTSQLSVLEGFEPELDLGISHNDPLQDDVQQVIRNKLSDAERRLASLDATEIPSTSLNSETNSGYSDIARRIQSYRTAIALHRMLPNDVLLEVFLYVPPDHVTNPPHTSGLCPKPYSLMRVCSKWRQLAFHLWRDVFMLYETNADLKRNAALTEDVLLCCDDFTPISLIARVVDTYQLRNKDVVEKHISDLIAKFAGSLKDFTWIGDSMILVNSLQCRPNSIELLEHISMDVGDGDPSLRYVEDHDRATDVFKDAHKLRTFTFVTRFNFVDSIFHPSSLILPWNQMTHLQFTRSELTSVELIYILFGCTNLSELRCTISNSGINHNACAQLPTPSRILPNLKLVWISCKEYLDWVFPLLDFPNLTSFQLYDQGKRSSNQEWARVMIPFFRRSNRITHLTLKLFGIHRSIPHYTLHALLCELPSLVHLSIWQTQFLRQQTLAGMASGDLVPMLESLECRVDVSDSDSEPFWHMLERRYIPTGTCGLRVAPASIRNMVVVTSSKERLEVLEQVKRLRANGVCIDFEVLNDRWCGGHI